MAGARGHRAVHARAVRVRERSRRAPHPQGRPRAEPREPRGPLRLLRARRDLQVRCSATCTCAFSYSFDAYPSYEYIYCSVVSVVYYVLVRQTSTTNTYLCLIDRYLYLLFAEGEAQYSQYVDTNSGTFGQQRSQPTKPVASLIPIDPMNYVFTTEAHLIPISIGSPVRSPFTRFGWLCFLY